MVATMAVEGCSQAVLGASERQLHSCMMVVLWWGQPMKDGCFKVSLSVADMYGTLTFDDTSQLCKHVGFMKA